MRKLMKSLEESGLLVKGVSETINNEVKGQKGGFLWILLSTILLRNLITGKGAIRAGQNF